MAMVEAGGTEEEGKRGSKVRFVSSGQSPILKPRGTIRGDLNSTHSDDHGFCESFFFTNATCVVHMPSYSRHNSSSFPAHAQSVSAHHQTSVYLPSRGRFLCSLATRIEHVDFSILFASLTLGTRTFSDAIVSHIFLQILAKSRHPPRVYSASWAFFRHVLSAINDYWNEPGSKSRPRFRF